MLDRVDVLIFVNEDRVVTGGELFGGGGPLPRFGVDQKIEGGALEVGKRRAVEPLLFDFDEFVEPADGFGDQFREREMGLGFGFPVVGRREKVRAESAFREIPERGQPTLYGGDQFRISFFIEARSGPERRQRKVPRPCEKISRGVVGHVGRGERAADREGGRERGLQRFPRDVRLACKVGQEVFEKRDHFPVTGGDPREQRFSVFGLFGGQIARLFDHADVIVELPFALREVVHRARDLEKDILDFLLVLRFDDLRREFRERFAARDGALLAVVQAVDQRLEHGAAQRPLVGVAEHAAVRADPRQVGKLRRDPAAETVDRADVCVREQKKLFGEPGVGGVFPDLLDQRL